jgi:hypothetical protein
MNRILPAVEFYRTFRITPDTFDDWTVLPQSWTAAGSTSEVSVHVV